MREPEQVRQDCARKLRTVLFAEHYQAILGCLLGEHFAERQPIDLKIAADDEISGPCDDGESFSAWVGPSEILLHNVRTIAKTCELNEEEIAYLLVRVAAIKREHPDSR